MVIPRGEKGRPANRFPVVTYGLIVVAILACFLFRLNAKLVMDDYGIAIVEIQRYLEKNRSKNLKIDPDVFEDVARDDNPQAGLREDIDKMMGSDLKETFRDNSADPSFSSARRRGRRSMEQGRLDGMVERAKQVLDGHPGYKSGHDPNNLRKSVLFTHLFVWFYLPALLGTLLILLLVGGFMEVIWGRLFLVVCFFAGGVFNAFLYSKFGISNDPMIGMSGALMALLGAFAVRYGMSTIHFSYIVGSGSLPGSFVVLLALGWEAALPRVMEFGPPPFDSIFVMPYAIHTMTLLLGVGIGMLFKSTGLEVKLNPFDDTDENIKINAIIQNALHAKDSGKLDFAFSLLGDEVRKHPESTELLLAFWDTAVAYGKPEIAAPKMLQLVRDRLKAGASAEAVEYWKAISGAHPEVEIDAKLLARLALLLGMEHREIASFTLARFFDDPGQEATPAVVAKLCHLARAIDVVIPVAIAEIALRGNDPDADDRLYLENLVERGSRVDAAQVGLGMEDMIGDDAAGGVAVEPASPLQEPVFDGPDDLTGSGEGGLGPDLVSASTPTVEDGSQFGDGGVNLTTVDDESEFGAGGGDLSAGDDESEFGVGAVGLSTGETGAGEVGSEEPPSPSAGTEGLGVQDFDTSAIDPSQLSDEWTVGGAGDAPGAEDAESSVSDPDAPSMEIGEESSNDWSAEQGSFDPSAISRDVAEAEESVRAAADDDNIDLEEDPVQEEVEAVAREPETELVAPEVPAVEAPAEPVVATPPPVEEVPIEEPVQEVAAPVARAIEVREYKPLAFNESSMLLHSSGGKKERLPLQKITAIALAGVRDLNVKPVVLVDLVLNWQPSAPGPVKVIRLRSDEFNPLNLCPDEASPLDALRVMVAKIVEISQATPLPNEAAVAGSPLRIFDSLDDYHREVLGAS